MGYREHLLMDVGVLEEWEPQLAMPREKASSQWARTASLSDKPDEGSKFHIGCYVHNRSDGSYQKSLS